MTGGQRPHIPGLGPDGAADVETLHDLALLLRQLRRRDARWREQPESTYRELAAKTGWSHATVGEYFTGKALPPTDRFDALIRLLGATPAEQGALATARDRVEERRRTTPPASRGMPAEPAAQQPGVSGGAGPWRVVPRQLPPAIRHFAGRTAELEALSSLVDQAASMGGGSGGSGGGTVVISAIHGTAGIGKTALAVHWAHRVADRFPDGQLYVNLRGFDPAGSPVKPAEAVRGFLDAFEVPAERIPATLDAQAGLYRSLMTGRRMLVLLDNARDADQVRPLLPGSAACLAVVTSRSRLTPLITAEAAQPLTLDLPTAADARDLLTRRLGSRPGADEPHAVDEIITLCARLPLALSIVAARAASHPGFPLAALAAELRDARRSLDALDGGDPVTDVRAVFSWSYRTLSTEGARLFRLLGLHPGPDIAMPVAAGLAGLPAARVRAALAELARAHLIAEYSPGRFSLHDLLRAYAAELARTRDAETARRDAIHRVLDHYLHTARGAAMLLNPHRDPIAPAPLVPGVTPELLDDPQTALAWFTAEHPALLAAIDQAADAGFDTHAWQLAWTLGDFLDRRGRWHDWAAAQRTALDAALRSGDTGGQAHALYAVGIACDRLGRYDDARTHLQQALSLSGDHTSQAYAHMRLGGLDERQGRYTEALGHAERALGLYRRTRHRAGLADALNLVGWCYARLGDHQPALTYCGQALTVQREIGDRFGEANSFDSLGYAHHHLGDHSQAVACYQQALGLFRDLGYRYYEAVALTHLGDTHRAAGDRAAAREAWQHALAILDELDSASTDQVGTRVDCPDADQVRTRLRHLDHPA